MKRMLIATLVSFLASGRVSTLQPTSLDSSTGYFPTTGQYDGGADRNIMAPLRTN